MNDTHYSPSMGYYRWPITEPTAQDPNNPTAAKVKAKDNWVVCEMAAYAEILFCITDNIRAMMDRGMGAKELWGALKKWYSVKQDSMRNTLMAKTQMARWDGNGPISAHCDYMVGLHTQTLKLARRCLMRRSSITSQTLCPPQSMSSSQCMRISHSVSTISTTSSRNMSCGVHVVILWMAGARVKTL